jgi:hypothetical protein
VEVFTPDKIPAHAQRLGSGENTSREGRLRIHLESDKDAIDGGCFHKA